MTPIRTLGKLMIPPEWFIVGSPGISLIGGKEFAQLIRRTKRSAPRQKTGVRVGYRPGYRGTHTHTPQQAIGEPMVFARGCPTIQKAIRGHSTDRSRLEIGKKLGQVASGWKLGTL